jgi:hypothetical protein
MASFCATMAFAHHERLSQMATDANHHVGVGVTGT